MITNIERPVFYNDMSFCKRSIKSVHPCKVIDRKPISTHQQKLSQKKGQQLSQNIAEYYQYRT